MRQSAVSRGLEASTIGLAIAVSMYLLSRYTSLWTGTCTPEVYEILEPHKMPPVENGVPILFETGSLHGHSLYEITVDSLQQLMSQGHLTAVDYVRFCLDRIRKVDPYLEAIMETNPDALDIAKALDVERQNRRVRSQLHGIPVIIKDNTATKDKMQTTAGSWALLGSLVPQDAFIVGKLREAGAIILGKSNMAEWNSARTKNHSDGYSPRGGQSRNPFRLDSNPSGSSSGSAIAVSANIVPLSFGTETDTSIIGPAKINGVVGIKPTVGLTSRRGVIPISSFFDTVGSFGRTVADAVRGLDAIAAVDHVDDATLQNPNPSQSNYSAYLSSRSALRRANFGLPIKLFFDVLPDQQKKEAMRVINAVREAGAQVYDVEIPSATAMIPPSGNFNWEHGEPAKSEFSVVKVDAFNDINKYLSELETSPVRALKDVVRFNEENTGTEGARPGDHPAYATGQDNFYEILDTGGVEDDTYHAAKAYIRKQSRDNGIDAALKYKLDGNQISLDALLILDRKGGGQQLAAQAGYPVITIPIGLDELGVPLGLSLQHTAWQEGTLIKWASAIEDLLQSNFGWRATPQYMKHSSKNIPVNKVPK